MTIEIQQLEDPILKHTSPPATDVLREQLQKVMERYTAEHTALETEYVKLQNAVTTPPKPQSGGCWASGPRLKMRTEM